MSGVGLPTVELLQAIRRIVREDRLRNESNPVSRAKRRIARGDGGATIRFGRTTSTITGATGTTTRTLGSGTVDLFENDATAGTNTNVEVTAYNTMTATIDADTYVHLAQLAPSNDWFITAVDCGV